MNQDGFLNAVVETLRYTAARRSCEMPDAMRNQDHTRAMQESLSLIPILYLIGAAQGAFLALALFSYSAGNRLANRYLGLLTLVFVAALIGYFFDASGLTHQLAWLVTIMWPKEFLYGTLIYFYVRELTLPGQFVLRGKQWWHFAPTLAHVLLTWPLLLLSPQRQLDILLGGAGQGFDGFMSLLLGDVELFLTIGQITLYLWLSLLLLRQHNRRIRQTFSNIEKINLLWLSRLLFGIFMVYLIWLIEEFLSQWLHQEAIWDALLGGSMVLLIYGMGYLGLRQPLIFSQPTGHTDEARVQADVVAVLELPSAAESDTNKYKNSPISAELGESLLQELEQYMQVQKPYLESDISLPGLAQQLGISLNYLSQVINQHTGKNFFDYINAYRIEQATSMLADDAANKLNILNLSMQVGFNSKSAFYNAFKKHTGQTPTQYRQSLKAA